MTKSRPFCLYRGIQDSAGQSYKKQILWDMMIVMMMMVHHDYTQTFKQCRDKLEILKSDYSYNARPLCNDEPTHREGK